MATASSSTPKVRRHIWRWANPRQVPPKQYFLEFGLILAAVIVGGAALFAEGEGATKNPLIGFGYDKTAAFTIGVYTLVVALWPIGQRLVTKPRPARSLLSLIVALLLLAVGVWLLAWFVMHYAARIGVAQWLWEARVGGVVALALNVVLVLRVSAVIGASPHPKVISQAETLAKAEAKLKKINEKAESAGVIQKKAQKARDKAQKKAALAHNAAEEASKAFSEAQKANKNTPQVKAEKAAAADVAAIQADLDTAQKLIGLLPSEIPKADPETRERFEQQLRDAKVEMKTIKTELTRARRTLTAAQRANRLSPTSQALIAAEAKRDAMSSKEAATKTSLEDAEAVLRQAELALTQVGEIKEKKEKKVDTAKGALEKAQKAADKKGGKWMTLTILLAILMFIGYTSWFGWVLTSANISLG